MLLLVNGVCGAGRAQQAAAPAVADAPARSVQEIATANSLTGPGKKPFEMKVDFEVFDYKGKPQEKGTLAYWWAGADGRSLEIVSPALGTVHSFSVSAEQTMEQRRELLLLSRLMPALVSPGESLWRVKQGVTFQPTRAGGVELRCLNPTEGEPRVDPAARVCIDAQDVVREVISSGGQTVRNRVGSFGDTHVAMDVTNADDGVRTVAAQVAELKSFDVAGSTVKLEPLHTPEAQPRIRISGGVIAGMRTGGAPPVYPPAAKQDHVTGTVVLAVEVSKTGQVTLVTPVSGPDERLVQAAADAVSTWTYRPYLLNGVAKDVSTTATVHFNLR